MAFGKRHRLGAIALSAGVLAAVGTATLGATFTTHARADVTFDSALFSLINQDRASAGLGPLQWDPQLASIGDGGAYGGCGFTVHGRANDMLERNYFAHTIAGCGSQNVFSVMNADGIGYRSAGENISWVAGITDPASAAQWVNTGYMNSPGHRANILNPSFTRAAVGSALTAPGQTWSGGGSTQTNVYVSDEEFIDATTPLPPQPAPQSQAPYAHGYWLVARDGGVFPFGNAPGYGSAGGMRLGAPVVGMARTPDGGGYWLAAADGGVFPFGDAPGYGSAGNLRLSAPIVAIAAVPRGRGYYLVAGDGGVFPFGPDAAGYGSTGNIRLNRPIVGMAVTPDGGGYWLVASDGGIFPFGNAAGYGSTGNIRLNKPIVGMGANPQGGGYWLVASDGGIFPFGPNAPGYGSAGNLSLARPIVGVTVTDDGRGYYMVASDGGIFPFGPSAGGYGSLGNVALRQPVTGMAATT
jgi:uncharacterized protein YkwD